MQKLTSNITVGVYAFDFVNEIEINSSWENFTDTCNLTIPKRISFNDKPIAAGDKAIFKTGDRIKIELGYDGILNTTFDGYVTNVFPNMPIEIQAEDFMYLFKQVSFSESFEKTTLKELVNFLLNKVKGSPLYPKEGIALSDIPSMELGKIRIKNSTCAQVFEMLRKDYGIISFFRGNQLNVGLKYYPDSRVEKKFNFERDMIDNDLIYKSEDDTKIKLKVVNIDSKTNKKNEYESGDADGESKTFFTYDLSEADIKNIATTQIKQYKYNGFEGSFTTFGTPFVRHGDAAVITSTKVPERNGTYLIKSVNTTFGMSGYRQSISLDQKIK